LADGGGGFAEGGGDALDQVAAELIDGFFRAAYPGTVVDGRVESSHNQGPLHLLLWADHARRLAFCEFAFV